MEEDEINEDANNSVDDLRSMPNLLNTELVLAIIAFSISFVWFVLSLFIFKVFSFYNFFIFGVGIIMLFLGIYKNRKRKNNDLDF